MSIEISQAVQNTAKQKKPGVIPVQGDEPGANTRLAMMRCVVKTKM
jgi:hypothetical protein